MANTNAPFGFMPMGNRGGSSAFHVTTRKIKSDYSTAIYKGDPVEVLSTGYIARGAAGETGHLTLGIFLGCKYLSTAFGYMKWSPYYPGSDAAADVEAFICDDPNAMFLVQSSGTAITMADLGQNIDYTLGTGSTRTGLSGASVDQSTLNTTATLPFRVVDIVGGVGDGFDSSSSYNRVIVAWNDQFYRAGNAGI